MPAPEQVHQPASGNRVGGKVRSFLDIAKLGVTNAIVNFLGFNKILFC
jgi:hypothetical protein